MSDFRKIAQYKSADDLAKRFQELGYSIPVDSSIFLEATSPLAKPAKIGSFTVGNRWCIHPMEGWDANRDGSPTEATLRRWRRFGESGAKLIWGGEAAAVTPAGRANPNQTLATEENRAGLEALLSELTTAHRTNCGASDDLLVGLQLTHSGRYCRPNSKQLEPKIAYHHPLLDIKYGIDPNDESVIITDDELEGLIDRYVASAKLAAEVGFPFVDVKACHGYLIHELLGGFRRPGKFGGDFEGRTRFLKTIVERIRQEIPGLMIGVRLSAFDIVPYQTSREIGKPMPFDHTLPYEFGFGVNPQDPLQYDLREPIALIREMKKWGVELMNVTGGSPYYNPHVQRPAAFPPSDGYLPPFDPLVGVGIHLSVTRACKEAVPEMPIVGTGYTYLQDYLPHVAQATVRESWVDFVGLGRMVLSYPTLPRDCFENGALGRKLVCRTFSDCTTAPRNGIRSGCYPLDDYYKESPEFESLAEIKGKLKGK